MIESVTTAPPTGTTGSSVGSPVLTPHSNVHSSLRGDFEAMVLRPLLDVALPRGQAVFGGRMPGETWRSMMVDALARDWAERDTVGIADALLGSTDLGAGMPASSAVGGGA